MDDPVEIELKLEADPAGLAALIDSGLLPSPGKRKRLHSIYYDTPRHEVLAHGFTLRVRKEGRDYIQTVKAEAGGAAGLFARNEWEWPAGDFSPDLGKTDLPFTGRIDPRTIRRVRPLFETDMDRIACVTDHDGAKIELAIDTGNVCAGDQASPLCEIELELLDGPAAPLFEFARAIDQQIPVRIGVLSKAERGYALARPKSQPVKAHRAPEVRLKAGDDAATCFRKIASSCIRHYRMNETLLLDTGAAEPLHQARVALRRLRSAFSLFKPLLATDPRSEMLRAEIKWLASELGRIRNLDVLIKRTRGKTRKQLMVVRAEAFAHLLPTINSARTRLLMIDLVEWLELGE